MMYLYIKVDRVSLSLGIICEPQEVKTKHITNIASSSVQRICIKIFKVQISANKWIMFNFKRQEGKKMIFHKRDSMFRDYYVVLIWEVNWLKTGQAIISEGSVHAQD